MPKQRFYRMHILRLHELWLWLVVTSTRVHASHSPIYSGNLTPAEAGFNHFVGKILAVKHLAPHCIFRASWRRAANKYTIDYESLSDRNYHMKVNESVSCVSKSCARYGDFGRLSKRMRSLVLSIHCLSYHLVGLPVLRPPVLYPTFRLRRNVGAWGRW